MPIVTLADIPREHARKQPDKIALRFEERTWTFAELDREANQVGHALAAEGVGAGDRFAYLDKNSPEYFTYLFGGAKLNAVSVAVNWRLAPPEMEYIINNSESKVLLVGEEFLGHLEKMKLETIEKIVVIGQSDAYPSYETWIEGHGQSDPGAPASPSDTCYQLYTSGTTGLPKGVELTHDNFVFMLREGLGDLGFDTSSVNLVAMPLFHIAGSGWGVVGLYQGADTVLLRDVDLEEILRVIPKYGVTHSVFVPAVLQFLLATPGVESTDFGSLRAILYGASPITEDVLVRSMDTFGCDFYQGYGLTESTGGVCILRPEDHDPGGPRAHLLRSCGQPVGSTETRVVDPDTGKDAPEGTVGEVWLRGPQIMKGYWKNPEATAKCFVDGWFRTGDAGYLKEGYLYIHDRVKDMIISGAENIYPAEIENVLMKLPGVADAAVIGVPDEKWGETVKAIVTRSDTALTEEAVIAYCRENLAHYKCPRSVDWIEAIPRNPSGKILKTELRKPYWKGRERMVN